MDGKKVYLSYDYANERHYKNLLLAWNSRFGFLVSDYEAAFAKSKNDAGVEKILSEGISQASTFLVIVGRNAHENRWMKWEINKATELGMPIVAVKTERENITPGELQRAGVNWVRSFTFEAISNAIGKS